MMPDAVHSACLVEAVGGGAAAAVMDGLPPWRLLACESAAGAYLVADIPEQNSREIEMVVWELPHGDQWTF